MKGKIALEEHIESPDFPATGTHNFTDPSYFKDVENRLREYKLRLDDMDTTGIQTTIISLTQPGVEGITDTKKAIDIARKMNDHIADFFVKANPGRFLGFAAVPLQDPDAAAKELERAVKELGFVARLSTVIPTSAMKTPLATLMKHRCGTSGRMFKSSMFLSICTPESLCQANSASTRAMRGYWVLHGDSDSKHQPMRYASSSAVCLIATQS